jgi:hypothetical protein
MGPAEILSPIHVQREEDVTVKELIIDWELSHA